MSGWATEYFSNLPPEFCIRFVKMKMKPKMKSEYKIFLKPNSRKISTNFHENLSPSPPEGERTAPPGRVDQHLTDKWSDGFVLVSTFIKLFSKRWATEYFSNLPPEFCIRFVKTKMKPKMKSEYKIFLKPISDFCIRFVKMKMKTKMKSEYKIFLKPTPRILYPICENQNENQNEK
jgi:hypothetical protein